MDIFKYEVFIDSDNTFYFAESAYSLGILGAEGYDVEYGLMYITANYAEYDTYSSAVANPLWF